MRRRAPQHGFQLEFSNFKRRRSTFNNVKLHPESNGVLHSTLNVK